MAYGKVKEFYRQQLEEIERSGLFKEERQIHTPQTALIEVEYPKGAPLREVINFCANNYLGLANHPLVLEAAAAGLKSRGYGISSVRFNCGTQDLHRELERTLSVFLGMEDTVLFSSCRAANSAVFHALLGPEDAMISDQLVHASIIDGMRLCDAQKHIYRHNDMGELEAKLAASRGARHRMIIVDGVFSMDGDMAPLDQICNLADRYRAMVFVDDSHATGFVGPTGRGTPEHFSAVERVDVLTTTLGKALGGASGGCVSARRELAEIVRQRAVPYLHSNSLPPFIAAASLAILSLLEHSGERRAKLRENTAFFRQAMQQAGLVIQEGPHPIVPVMLYNAKLAQDFSRDLYAEGIYAIGFFYPVVAKGQARIRCQVSAVHERSHLEKAVAAFKKIGKKYGILGLSKDEIIAQYGL